VLSKAYSLPPRLALVFIVHGNEIDESIAARCLFAEHSIGAQHHLQCSSCFEQRVFAHLLKEKDQRTVAFISQFYNTQSNSVHYSNFNDQATMSSLYLFQASTSCFLMRSRSRLQQQMPNNAYTRPVESMSQEETSIKTDAHPM
jgi:hypothetical protein